MALVHPCLHPIGVPRIATLCVCVGVCACGGACKCVHIISYVESFTIQPGLLNELPFPFHLVSSSTPNNLSLDLDHCQLANV